MAKLFGIEWDTQKQEQNKLAQATAEYNRLMAVANNPALPPQERLLAAEGAQNFKALVDANSITKEKSANTVREERTKKALEKAGLAVPQAAAGPPALGFKVAPQEGAGVQTTAADMVQAMFPGITVTSTNRTEADQERLRRSGYNPAKNSMHLQNGKAVDFVPPKGSDVNAMLEALTGQGLWAYYDKKRGHIHADMRQPGTRSTGGSVPIAFMDPAAAQAMIPNPRALRGVDLPNAPERELPGDVPLLQAPDKSVLDQLSAVIMPQAPDQKFDSWDRIAAMLQGAAGAAAGADPMAGLGQFLLRAGGGAAQGFRAERKEQEQEIRAYLEAKRQAEITRAMKGIDIDLDILGVQNQNLDRQYKGTEAKKDVKFENANAQFETNLKEVLTNLGISNQNIENFNQADMTRAKVGLDAMAGGVDATNTSMMYSRGGGAAGKGLKPAEAQEAQIEQGLIAYGMDASNAKMPTYGTARGTMAARLAQDLPGMMQNFAQELVLVGAAPTILAPTKGGDPESEKAKADMLKALRMAKKAGDPASMEVAQKLAGILATNPELAYQIARDFQATSPSARIILGELSLNKPGAK